MVKKYIGADEVKTIVPQVSIFEIDDFERELEKLGSDAAKADAITSRTTKTCTEKMEEDPTFYKRLSALIEEAIEELNQYQNDMIVKEYLEQGVNLKKVILLFHGWELVEMKEVE